MNNNTTWIDSLYACCIACGLVLLFRLANGKRSVRPLPPGPKKLPVIGNLLDAPSEKGWVTFSKWGEAWGDIISMTILGQPMVILNSAEVALDLLDKRSNIYSDRPVLQMAGILIGYINVLTLLPYGERFRLHRRMFHNLIGTHSKAEQFLPLEEAETHQFLQKLLENPEDLADHIRHTAGAIIFRISHGYKVKEHDDPFVNLARRALDNFAEVTVYGAYLVDILPILRYIPEWFPGAGFKRIAKMKAKTAREAAGKPYVFVKEQMASGVAEKSFTSSLLEENETITADLESDIKWAATSMYGGGADTTVSAILSFFRAMVLYPNVQKKAQAEIDSVIGNDRLPSFIDRARLPYVDALVKEVHRHHCVIPTGVAHRLMEDDVYDGYFIPKGSVVTPNLWKMLHDPRDYQEPMLFNPDRFIASGAHKSERDPRDICFGFGRRICPGRILADSSVFIACAMVLAVFNVTEYVDPESGTVVIPSEEQTSALISHPVPFKCTIRPRSGQASKLIKSEVP